MATKTQAIWIITKICIMEVNGGSDQEISMWLNPEISTLPQHKILVNCNSYSGRSGFVSVGKFKIGSTIPNVCIDKIFLFARLWSKE